MTIIHGFQLQREHHISELKTEARIFRHTKTGAELLSLSNDDENKVFGIAFRTPPSNSTGVAHILEHSVLCGSRKYPVKEPFVELLKGSLQTFLNAMTYPDKTCYPVASQNLQDFYNLIDVYLDAVFYPRLNRFIFQQEGWHFELESTDHALTYKGVVFNEMKGAYSSPDTVLAEYSIQSLFPDTPYGFDSGGDPKIIPNLTFEQFQAFHKKYYHPSNARIYFYGDDEPNERLKILNEYLKDFDAISIASSIQLQPPFRNPGVITRSFMVSNEGETDTRGMVTVNWLLPETTDVQTNFALRILQYILLGMPASPLRKALIDSRLGEDIAGEGLGTELRQIYFSTGLKGVVKENTHRVEPLIMETLHTLTEKGIDPLTVEAAINTISFRLRENNSGNLPRGLLLMLRSLTTWLYGGDPLVLLTFESPLMAIESHLKSNSSFFEALLHSHFLKNPHRTTLILEPDPSLREKEEHAERNRLVKARSAMSAAQIKGIIEDTHELKRLQKSPDPPGALAAIPALRLIDLDKKNKTIPSANLDRSGTTILFHDLFTNGIAYLDLGFDLHTLPDKYLPYVPLFGRTLVEMGTEKEDFVTLTQRISRKTGGISPQLFTSPKKNSKQSVARLFLRGKVMQNHTEELTAILHDVLLTVRLDNPERFRQMVMEEKARVEQSLVPRGHQLVNLRLRSHFAEAHWAAEQMGGISYLFFLRRLSRAVDENWSDVLAALREMLHILTNNQTTIFNITSEESCWSRFEAQVNDLVDALPGAPVTPHNWSNQCPPVSEGMTIPSQVNFVGKGAGIYELGYRFNGSALVISRYIRNAWLWDSIRVQGGAYGAFCLLDRLSGALSLVSYRDPNIGETLDAFDQTAQFLRDTVLSDEEVTKSIIGAIGDLDAHMLPDVKGYISMLRCLSGDTDDARQQMRDEILGTQATDFNAFAEVLEAVKESGVVKILGSPSALKKITSERPAWLSMVKVI
jgi:Zn-dependent M16 (insulinase) family peptidase